MVGPKAIIVRSSASGASVGRTFRSRPAEKTPARPAITSAPGRSCSARSSAAFRPAKNASAMAFTLPSSRVIWATLSETSQRIVSAMGAPPALSIGGTRAAGQCEWAAVTLRPPTVPAVAHVAHPSRRSAWPKPRQAACYRTRGARPHPAAAARRPHPLRARRPAHDRRLDHGRAPRRLARRPPARARVPRAGGLEGRGRSRRSGADRRSPGRGQGDEPRGRGHGGAATPDAEVAPPVAALAYRSEEHTSELQSPDHLVCRLLLEKKK